MRQFSILLIAILASGCTKAEPLTDTPEGETATITYASGKCTTDGLTLPYRYSEISASDKVDPCIVLVLHGGPLKGGDNEKQLQETALIKVAGYLSEQMIPSVLIAPHCPEKNARGRLANWVQFAPVLEPKTHSLEGCCSVQLSYGTKSALVKPVKAPTKILNYSVRRLSPRESRGCPYSSGPGFS